MAENFERSKIDQGSEFSFKLFIFSINLILLYLVFLIESLQIVGLIGIAILTILSLKLLSTFIFTDNKSDRILDYLTLSRKYRKINSKFSVMSIIGLVIATLIISQSIIMSTGFQQLALDDHLDGRTANGLRIFVEGVPSQNATDNWDLSIKQNIPQINGNFNFDINNITTDSSYKFRLAKGPPRLITDGPGLGEYFIPFDTVTPNDWDLGFLNLLNQLPSFNETELTANQTILMYSHNSDVDISTIASNDTIKILLGESQRIPDYNFTVFPWKIDHVWIPTVEDYNYIFNNTLDDELHSLVRWGDNPIFYMNLDNQWNYYSEFLDFELEDFDTRMPPIIFSNSYVEISTPIISEESVARYMVRLEQFRTRVSNWVGDQIEGSIAVISPLYTQLEDYQDQTSLPLSVLSLLAIGPVLGLSIYLIYFSMNMAEERKLKHITIIKQRGSSNNQLKNVMILEMIYIAIFASVVGMILSIPLILNLFQVVGGYDQIKLDSILFYIPKSWLWRLPLVGIILSIDISIQSVIKLSALDISDDFYQNNDKSLLYRIPFDKIFFAISLFVWFFIFFVPIMDEPLFNVIVSIPGPIALILFFISFPWIFAKIFGFTISNVAMTLWKRFGGIFTFAIKNLDRYKSNTNKLLAFFILGLILMNTALILPVTYENWSEEQISYNIGAEVYVDGISSENSTRWKMLEILHEIDVATEIVKLNLYRPSGGITILGVNTTTALETMYWQDEFSTSTLEQLIDAITGFNKIIMQTEVMEVLDIEVNGEYVIYRGESIPLTIQGTFNTFPNLVFDFPRSDSDGNKIVDNIPIFTSLETVKTLDPRDTLSNHGAYLKIKNDTDIEVLESKIQNIFSDTDIEVTSVEQERIQYFGSQINQVIEATFFVMLFLTLVIGIIAQAYFAFILIGERQKEIGILKSFGMIKSQITSIFLIEWFIIFLFAITAGIIGGIFLSFGFMTIISVIYDQFRLESSFDLILPLESMGIFSLIFLIAGLIIFLVPIIIYASKETQSILREE